MISLKRIFLATLFLLTTINLNCYNVICNSVIFTPLMEWLGSNLDKYHPVMRNWESVYNLATHQEYPKLILRHKLADKKILAIAFAIERYDFRLENNLPTLDGFHNSNSPMRIKITDLAQAYDLKCFHNPQNHELLIFLANQLGEIYEVRLFNQSYKCTKIVKVKANKLRLENIASAGAVGNILKIGFTPNEVVGSFKNFEDGQEILL